VSVICAKPSRQISEKSASSRAPASRWDRKTAYDLQAGQCYRLEYVGNENWSGSGKIRGQNNSKVKPRHGRSGKESDQCVECFVYLQRGGRGFLRATGNWLETYFAISAASVGNSVIIRTGMRRGQKRPCVVAIALFQKLRLNRLWKTVGVNLG
jgi:hypothetical protein